MTGDSNTQPKHTDAELERQTGEPHIDGWPLYSGLPSPAQPKGTATARDGWKHDCAALLTNDVELWVDRCPHCGKPAPAPAAATQAPAPSQPKGTALERLLAQVREVCAATLRAGPGVAVSLPAELADEGRKFMRGEPSLIEQLPFADVQKLGDVLNETPATVQASALPKGMQAEATVKPMTAQRAAYFMERFRHEEKLLGPNEQAALDFVITMLEAAQAPAPAHEPIASVERTPAGPKLFIRGVMVRWWLGCIHDREAEAVAAEINGKPYSAPAQATAVAHGPSAWVPHLSDCADGVTGHYAIARHHPSGYREVWNLRKHCWAAFSDDVLTLEQANALLRQIVIPTAPPAFAEPAVEQAINALKLARNRILQVVSPGELPTTLERAIVSLSEIAATQAAVGEMKPAAWRYRTLAETDWTLTQIDPTGIGEVVEALYAHPPVQGSEP